MSPFDFVNSINYSKKNLMVDEQSEEEYIPFLTNRALSYFPDTILYAQEMNINGHIDKKLQYNYFINNIRPAKRFAKWIKKKENNDIEAIRKYYNYNYKMAKVAISILSEEQINIIKKKLEKVEQNE